MTVDRKRLRELLQEACGDHKRGCEGRTYRCDCGYDDNVYLALKRSLALLDTIDAAEQPAPDDAVRFDWFFGPANKASFMGTYLLGCDRRWTPNEWREAIDAAIQAQERTP